MTEEEFDRIIDRYPYPIASLMSRLGTVECLDPGDRRLNCILDTAEAASRFLCALVLCLCRDHGESQGIIEPLHVDLHKSLPDYKDPSADTKNAVIPAGKPVSSVQGRQSGSRE